jgi:hypothetical protein
VFGSCFAPKLRFLKNAAKSGPTTIHQPLTRMRGPSDALTNNKKPNIDKDRLNLGSSYLEGVIA